MILKNQIITDIKSKIARELEVDRRTVASSFLIMYYAEEQYFIKQYKKTK